MRYLANIQSLFFSSAFRYTAVIALTLLCGILSGWPQIMAAQRVDGFQGIYRNVNNDESYYLARAREVTEGHAFVANPYLYEYKNGLPMQVWLSDYLLARPLAWFGLNVVRGYQLYDFILPPILFLMTWVIFMRLTHNQHWHSLAWASALHLNIFFYQFNRAPSPQLNFIFWLLTFICWWRMLRRPSIKAAVLFGACLGALFYIYTYYWVLFVIILTVFIISHIILRLPLPYRRYTLAIGIAALIGLPYFYYLRQAADLAYYQESLKRVGMLATHFPSGFDIVIWGTASLAAAAIAWKKNFCRLNSQYILLVSGVIGVMIAVNHHLVTGKNLQFSSHYWMSAVFLCSFLLAYILTSIAECYTAKNIRLPLRTREFMLRLRDVRIGILLITFVAIMHQPLVFGLDVLRGRALPYDETMRYRQQYAAVFTWLNENTAAESVVYANGDISALAPVYTHNNVFFNSRALLHFMPDTEGRERFVLNNIWEDFTPDFVVVQAFGIWGAYYSTNYDYQLTKNKLRRLVGLPPHNYEEIPPVEIDRIISYAQEAQRRSFAEQLRAYRLDYVVQDRNKDAHWRVNELQFLEPVYEVNDMVIYKVSHL